MKINALGFGIAGAITTSIFYTTIAMLIKTWPYDTLKFISTSHMIPRLENIAPYIKVNTNALLMGISINFIFAFLFFWLLGIIYNLLTPSKN